MASYQRPTEERFWSNVKKAGPDDCWEWCASRVKFGYGQIKSGAGFPVETTVAHRISFFLANGYLPEVVMHICDNPPCVNPAHLRGGTTRDNNRDMWEKGRQNILCGEDHGNAKTTEAQVLEMRKRFKDGERLIDISRSMNLGYDSTRIICHRRLWKHVQ